MDFLKRNFSTILLVTLAAAFIGIGLGSKECPTCVVTNVFQDATASSDAQKTGTAKSAGTIETKPWQAVAIDGTSLSHKDLQGKISLLVYWATWCGPCKSEIPDLIALRNEFPNTELELIAFSVDNPSKDLAAFAEEHAINYRIARVNDSVIEAYGQPDFLPTLLIVDPQGEVKFRHSGVVGHQVLSQRVNAMIGPRHAATASR